MGGLNRSILCGRLVADPDIRYTKDEKAVTHFRLAINRSECESAEFINCVAFNGLAKVCGDYLKKGKLVAVEGRIQIRKYESKEGIKRTSTEIIIDNMQMLSN